MKIVFVAKRPSGSAPWIEFGSDRESYETWAPHVCAMACVRSLLITRDGYGLSLWELTKQGIAHGVYVIEPEARIVGAFHFPLKAMLEEKGIRAEVFARKEVCFLRERLVRGEIVIASVVLKNFNNQTHLVLIHGYDALRGEFSIHDNANVLRSDGNDLRMALAELKMIFTGRGLACKWAA